MSDKVEFQRSIIQLLCKNTAFAMNHGSSIKEEYFDIPTDRIVFNLAYSHILSYEKEVSKSDLILLTDDYVMKRGYSSDAAKQFKETIVEIFRIHITSEQFLIDQLSEFCTRRELQAALHQSIDILAKGENYEMILKLIDKALAVGSGSNMGLSFKDLENLPAIYRARYNPTSLVKSGFSKYDYAFAGGMAPGELHVVQAPPKPLFGNTLIKLLDGTSTRIDELERRCQENPQYKFWVYSSKPDGTVVPGQGHSCFKSREVSQTYRITFDNGKTLECDYDHEWMLRDGSYQRADQLMVGQSLMPLYWEFNTTGSFLQGYERVKHNTGKLEFTHRLVARHTLGKPSLGIHTHHKDGNRLNNVPENLEYLTGSEHNRLHMNELWADPDHIIHEAHSAELSERNKRNWTTDPGRWEQIATANLDKVNSDKDYQRECASLGGKEVWKDYDKTKNTVIKNLEKVNRVKQKEAASGAGKRRWKEATPEAKRVNKINMVLGRARKTIDYLTENNLTVTEATYNRFKSQKAPGWISYQENLQQQSQYNHTITKIEVIKHETPVPVYCFKVDEWHNFVVDLGDSSGVFSHNTGKSTLAANIGAFALASGQAVFHATMEIKAEDVMAKYSTRITGLTYEEIMTVEDAIYKKKMERFTNLQPKLFVNYWTEQTINALVIRSWISRIRSTQNINPGLILVDYDDCLLPVKGTSTKDREKDMYNDAGEVYSDLISLGDYFKCPVLTFAQPKREAWEKVNRNELIYSYDLAHSAKKVHKCYSISSLNFPEASNNGVWFVDLVRRGVSNVKIPIVRDLTRGIFRERDMAQEN